MLQNRGGPDRDVGVRARPWAVRENKDRGDIVTVVVIIGLSVAAAIEACREAQVRRREFRRALTVYLDLVALDMAGSAAPASDRSTRSSGDQWTALTALGERIGVTTELYDLGNIVRLIAHDGARVQESKRPA